LVWRGFTSEEKNGNRIIVGPVADQAALYGIMKKKLSLPN